MGPLFGAEIPAFAYGVMVGAALLLAGVLAGLWFGRKASPDPRPLESEQVMSFLSGLVDWTSGFSGDMAQYRSNVERLKDRMQGSPEATQPDDDVLAEIAQINESLHSRLDAAEMKLKEQATEIASYVSEARTDTLTGLPNRRVFDDEMRRRVAEWRRHGTPLAVVMLDIDHFKMFNDRHGHLAGDEVLRCVAEVLQGCLREADVVARYGGEEFGIILPASERDDACHTAERVRSSIERASFRYEQLTLDVTISCGAAQILEDEAVDSLIKRADEALYASKDAGRNFAHFHDGARCLPVTAATPSGSHSAAPPAGASLDLEHFHAVCSELRDKLRRYVQKG